MTVQLRVKTTRWYMWKPEVLSALGARVCSISYAVRALFLQKLSAFCSLRMAQVVAMIALFERMGCTNPAAQVLVQGHIYQGLCKGQLHRNDAVRIILGKDMVVIWHEELLHSGARTRV